MALSIFCFQNGQVNVYTFKPICLDSLVGRIRPHGKWQAWSSIAGVSSSQIASKGLLFCVVNFRQGCVAWHVQQKMSTKNRYVSFWRVQIPLSEGSKKCILSWWTCTSSRQFRRMFISVYIISYCFGKSAQRWLLEDAQRRQIGVTQKISKNIIFAFFFLKCDGKWACRW